MKPLYCGGGRTVAKCIALDCCAAPYKNLRLTPLVLCVPGQKKEDPSRGKYKKIVHVNVLECGLEVSPVFILHTAWFMAAEQLTLRVVATQSVF